ncbi:MAG: hypothetical protein KAX50_01700 [Saprospiraceae bacterium]|nr:hypothetical protein [Saprospiraceae bacterium]
MKYFTIDTFSGWGITPDEGVEDQLKIRSERRINNFKAWDDPSVINAILAHPHNEDGALEEPDILDDVLGWYVGTNPGGIKIVISESFKKVLDEFKIAPNWLYEFALYIKKKYYKYYAFVPSLTPESFSFIDFSNTVYFSQKERKPDGIVQDNIRFENYSDYMQKVRALIPERLALLPRNGQLFLKQKIDFFATEHNVFFISDNLKNALENAGLRFSCSPLGKYGYIPIKEIIVPSSSDGYPNELEHFPSHTFKLQALEPLNKYIQQSDFELPNHIQETVVSTFPEQQQHMAMQLAGYILSQTWNVGSQQLLDSLFYLSEGNLNNVVRYFPLYDPRDVVEEAQFKQKKNT